MFFVISFRKEKNYHLGLVAAAMMLTWPIASPIFYILFTAREKNKSERKVAKTVWLGFNGFECWFEALPQVSETRN